MLEDVIRQKIVNLLESTKVADFTTIDDFGYPITKTLHITSQRGLDEIWFVTHRSSDKIDRITKNPKTNVHVIIKDEQVSLVGESEIREDFIARHINWNDNLLHQFPLGPSDPDLVTIKFSPHYASYRSETVQTNGRV